jgi:hypothetical protein
MFLQNLKLNKCEQKRQGCKGFEIQEVACAITKKSFYVLLYGQRIIVGNYFDKIRGKIWSKESLK